MHVNIELRNLRGDERDELLEAVRRGGDEIEIKIRARAVEVDTFDREARLRCRGAQVSVHEGDERGRRRWRSDTPEPERGRERGRERPRGSLFEVHLGGSSSPRQGASERMMQQMMSGPLILPPPAAPAWASDIGDTAQRLGEAQRMQPPQSSAYDSGEDDEGPSATLRFGHRPHGWGH